MNLGKCHQCHAPIPSTTADGKPAREGINYKQVLGAPEVMWHYLDPRMPDCFHIEGNDPTSPWYNDPSRFIEDDDYMPGNFERAYYESLDD